MKLKFKKQAYQTRAVDAVLDCFKGQLNSSGVTYRIDPGANHSTAQRNKDKQMNLFAGIGAESGLKNSEISLNETQLLENIQLIQRNQNLPQSEVLIKNAVSPVNLDIEMETGTGKTYCYIKTMFEMHKKYGWNKFIVVVPSISTHAKLS